MRPLLHPWFISFLPIAGLALVAWAICSWRRNVGLIDIGWPLFLLAAGVSDALLSPSLSWGGAAALLLLLLWSLRLAIHLAHRNWSAPEDRRYAAIRARNEPGFWWKSLFYVFLLQAVLAWIVSLPLAALMSAQAGHPLVLSSGLALVLIGFLWETIADGQLTRFRAQKNSAGRVLDSGLWRYCRHPNYFGECLVWWGFFVAAASPQTLWSVISPLLMTVLLLRVSGVTLLEKDIGERRPGYRAYIARTPAFFPWPPRDRPTREPQ
jgi:steroid 5-alpha reductase family enzyme